MFIRTCACRSRYTALSGSLATSRAVWRRRWKCETMYQDLGVVLAYADIVRTNIQCALLHTHAGYFVAADRFHLRQQSHGGCVERLLEQTVAQRHHGIFRGLPREDFAQPELGFFQPSGR